MSTNGGPAIVLSSSETAQGTKLFNAVMNDRVAFEAEDHTASEDQQR
jgi:hypothetical protein